MKTMMNVMLALWLTLLFSQSNVLACVVLPTSAPQVIEDPYTPDNQAVQFYVCDNEGDISWADLEFKNPVEVAAHSTITVQFDIYRTMANNDWLENFQWGWLADGIDPGWGGQWGALTYPLGLSDTSTLDGWTTIVLTWDFDTSLVASQYGWQGSDPLPDIDTDQTLNAVGANLYGWAFALAHESETGSGDEFVLIDNFVIWGSDIYNSQGFEGFALGDLNEQGDADYGTWYAGFDGQPIPLPASILLFLSGLIGLIGIKRRDIQG